MAVVVEAGFTVGAEVLAVGASMVVDPAVVAAFAARAVTAVADSVVGAALSVALGQAGTATDSDGRA